MSTRARRRQFPATARDPFVIAEIGVNHDGDTDRALALVDAAADADADAVKFQWFRAKSLISNSAELADYQRDAGETDVAGMLERLELDADAMARVLERAHDRGLLGIATVFTKELVSEANELPWDLLKTSSPDLVNRPLIESLLETGRPLIMSTGGSSMEEVREALGWTGSASVALLHCVSSYPTPPDSAALSGIGVLADELDLPVGYSDHTCELETGGIAVACGATILEKHLTWSNGAAGPDHAASLEPTCFGRYVAFARMARSMIGDPVKAPLALEIEVVAAARQSIAASQDLVAGALLQEGDLTTMRPGGGLPPARLGELLGRKLARDVKRGGLLALQDLVPVEGAS
jgi:sialic acid synthase SpsE